jgi:hypothetical protein
MGIAGSSVLGIAGPSMKQGAAGTAAYLFGIVSVPIGGDGQPAAAVALPHSAPAGVLATGARFAIADPRAHTYRPCPSNR